MRPYWYLLRTMVAFVFMRPNRPERTFYLQSLNFELKDVGKAAPYSSGLTESEASRMTELFVKRNAYDFFTVSLLCDFPRGVTLSIAHLSLPVRSGVPSFGVEITGEPTEKLATFLWQIISDCNLALCDHDVPTGIAGPITAPMRKQWNDIVPISSADDVSHWLHNSVKPMMVY